MSDVEHVAVIGNGMVGARFADELALRDTARRYRISVFGAEEHEPYNRVLLSDFVAGNVAAGSLTLPRPDAARVAVRRGTAVVGIDRRARLLRTTDGLHTHYDLLVLATGARARVLPLTGLDPQRLLPGVHVLRSLDDAREIVAATMNAERAIVIGGGVLGIEAATGLARRGLAVTVVHAADWVMERQLGPAAAEVAQAMLAAAGVACEVAVGSQGVVQRDGRATGLELTDGRVLRAELIVMACGTQPSIELAEAAGLPIERGIRVGVDLASPADPRVFAIGDCASPPGGGTGLIAQGWEQARQLAQQLVHGCSPADAGTEPTDVVRVKGAGIDMVHMGRPLPGDRTVRLSDPQAMRHLEVSVRDGRVVGATCIGAGAVASDIVAAYTRGTQAPVDPAALLLRPAAPPSAGSPTTMPDRFTVCRCNGVSKGDLKRAWGEGARSRTEIAARTRATTGCGGCGDVVDGILDWLRAADPDPSPMHPPAPVTSQGVPTLREPQLTAAKHPSHRSETSPT